MITARTRRLEIHAPILVSICCETLFVLFLVELQSAMAVIGHRLAIDKLYFNYAYLCAHLILAEDEKINTGLSTGARRPIGVGISTVVTRPVNMRG